MGWFHDAWPGHEGYLVGWERHEYHGLLLLQRPAVPLHCREPDRTCPVCGHEPQGSSTCVHDSKLRRTDCLREPGHRHCRFCARALAPTYPTERADLELQRVAVKVHAVQVGCDCGWRSPLLAAPFGTEWHDGLLRLPESAQETETSDRLGLVPFEAKCVRLWYEHCRQCGGSSDARPSFGEPPIGAFGPEPAIDHGANREFVRRYFLKR